jgi:adenylate cyclase
MKGYDRRALARRIRYWYTYRTAVAVVLAVAMSLLMFGLYTQQLACDAGSGCYVNIAVHPEDRLFSASDPNAAIEVVGIDDASVKTVGQFPVPRSVYALALRNLEAAGAALVAFDVSFPDARDPSTDDDFATALKDSTVPVLLAYPAEQDLVRDGYVQQSSPKTDPGGLDQIPLKKFWCGDANQSPSVPCQSPDRNVVLVSPDYFADSDGVVRKVPMFVQPACYSEGTCSTPTIYPLGFQAARIMQLLPDFAGGPNLTESGSNASFGSAWRQPLPVDGRGGAVIDFVTGPGYFKKSDRYLSFGDLWTGSFHADQVKGKVVLIGAYNLTGVHDEVLTPDGNGTAMPGVEMHANVLSMFLPPPAQPKFLAPESPAALLLILLLLALATAIGVSRVTVLWGFAGTVGAIALFTIVMSGLSVFNGWVPDLFHPWLAIAITYTGVTAYRFLYEDREKRRVTALFGRYLKPEIVEELARTRRGADDILRGGERRDITLMFVDIRGFTAMSESMAAQDVTEVVQMYLEHLSEIVFTWDGTIEIRRRRDHGVLERAARAGQPRAARSSLCLRLHQSRARAAAEAPGQRPSADPLGNRHQLRAGGGGQHGVAPSPAVHGARRHREHRRALLRARAELPRSDRSRDVRHVPRLHRGRPHSRCAAEREIGGEVPDLPGDRDPRVARGAMGAVSDRPGDQGARDLHVAVHAADAAHRVGVRPERNPRGGSGRAGASGSGSRPEPQLKPPRPAAPAR